MAKDKDINIELPEDILKSIGSHIEALLFASDEPIPAKSLSEILSEYFSNGKGNEIDAKYFSPEYLISIINALNKKYYESNQSFHIIEIAGGYQFATLPKYAKCLGILFKEKSKRRLSQSALETLAIIVFKQPISKPEIENIRGVNSDYVLSTLLEKNLITIVGRADTVGRPLLYGTTQEFLKHFGLKDTKDLPKLKEIEEIMNSEEFKFEVKRLEESLNKNSEESDEEDIEPNVSESSKDIAGESSQQAESDKTNNNEQLQNTEIVQQPPEEIIIDETEVELVSDEIQNPIDNDNPIDINSSEDTNNNPISPLDESASDDEYPDDTSPEKLFTDSTNILNVENDSGISSTESSDDLKKKSSNINDIDSNSELKDTSFLFTEDNKSEEAFPPFIVTPEIIPPVGSKEFDDIADELIKNEAFLSFQEISHQEITDEKEEEEIILSEDKSDIDLQNTEEKANLTKDNEETIEEYKEETIIPPSEELDLEYFDDTSSTIESLTSSDQDYTKEDDNKISEVIEESSSEVNTIQEQAITSNDELKTELIFENNITEIIEPNENSTEIISPEPENKTIEESGNELQKSYEENLENITIEAECNSSTNENLSATVDAEESETIITEDISDNASIETKTIQEEEIDNANNETVNDEFEFQNDIDILDDNSGYELESSPILAFRNISFDDIVTNESLINKDSFLSSEEFKNLLDQKRRWNYNHLLKNKLNTLNLESSKNHYESPNDKQKEESQKIDITSSFVPEKEIESTQFSSDQNFIVNKTDNNIESSIIADNIKEEQLYITEDIETILPLSTEVESDTKQDSNITFDEVNKYDTFFEQILFNSKKVEEEDILSDKSLREIINKKDSLFEIEKFLTQDKYLDFSDKKTEIYTKLNTFYPGKNISTEDKESFSEKKIKNENKLRLFFKKVLLRLKKLFQKIINIFTEKK
ncbi:MAG TPA: SMC-Scp complex subunit ScpB [Ignavibacteria bacterium]